MKGFFISSVKGPAEKADPAYWFVFRERKMLVVMGGVESSPPLLIDIRDTGIYPVRELYLGTLDGVHCYAAELDGPTELPKEMAFHSLRSIHLSLIHI